MVLFCLRGFLILVSTPKCVLQFYFQDGIGMRKWFKTLLLITLFLMGGADLYALELYSIVHAGCSRATGLIIDVDEEQIHLLTLKGELLVLEKEGVEHILVFNTLDNPIPQLEMSGPLRDYVREVAVQGDVENDFIGWPIRFMEDLIVFYDTEGKIHLVDVDLIQGFSTPETMGMAPIELKQHKSYRFGFGNNLPECRVATRGEGELIQPTRMISDPISISKFIRVYRDGFTQLDRFQKRTSFYARPYLYQEETTVGLVVDREDYQEELPSLVPLNFQWPTGSNYGPQGILNVGSNVNLHLPNNEPVFAVDFSGKYHFLSVLFSGNIWAFSYGKAHIVENRSYYKDFFSKREADELLVFPHYNQLAMTGLEWGPYSFSAGYYYPVFGIQADGIFREILSERSMPMINLKYTTERTRWQLLASDIDIRSSAPSDKNIRLIYAEEMANATTLTQASEELITELDQFELDAQFARFNLDIDINQDVTVGFSETLLQGIYDEKLGGSDYTLTYRQYITSTRLQQQFGEYVSLKGYLNYFIRHYNSDSVDDDEAFIENKVSFTVVVEFIL